MLSSYNFGAPDILVIIVSYIKSIAHKAALSEAASQGRVEVVYLSCCQYESKQDNT
jgi:hypothetical protein